MAANKRTADERESVLADLARRYCRGELQADVATALGVTQQQVSHDLVILRKRWAESLANFSSRKSEELAKIDHLEATYWLAWVKSTETREISLQEKTHAGTEEKPDTRLKASMRKEERDGNPAFLAGVQWCINKRCELLGLNAPTKIAATDPTGEHAASDPHTELLGRIAELAARTRIREVHPEPPGDGSTGTPDKLALLGTPEAASTTR